MIRRFAIVACLATMLCGFISGCDEIQPSADQTTSSKQEQLAKEANAQSGLPGITTFTEKKLMRHLYELRDKNITTYAYVPDMNGRLWHLCDSIGYGLPYGTQYTAPERPAKSMETQESGNLALPQAEPNGLFMPPTAEGTWIICTGSNGDTLPVYVEPRVIVSPFKLNAVGEYAAR